MVMIGVDMGRADYKVSEIVLQAGYFPSRVAGVMIVGESDGPENRLLAIRPA